MSDLMAVLDNTDTELKREKEKVAVAKENLLIQEVEEQGKKIIDDLQKGKFKVDYETGKLQKDEHFKTIGDEIVGEVAEALDNGDAKKKNEKLLPGVGGKGDADAADSVENEDNIVEWTEKVKNITDAAADINEAPFLPASSDLDRLGEGREEGWAAHKLVPGGGVSMDAPGGLGFGDKKAGGAVEDPSGKAGMKLGNPTGSVGGGDGLALDTVASPGNLDKEIIEAKAEIVAKKVNEEIEKVKQAADPAVMQVDVPLLTDIVTLAITAAIFGLLAVNTFLPTTAGFLLGGMFIGPSCLSLILNVKEVQTLSQFGSVFILFEQGLMYSLENRGSRGDLEAELGASDSMSSTIPTTTPSKLHGSKVNLHGNLPSFFPQALSRRIYKDSRAGGFFLFLMLMGFAGSFCLFL